MTGTYRRGEDRVPRPCLGPCKRMVRPTRTKIEQWPDTKAEYHRGMCYTCVRQYAERQEPLPKPEVATEEQVRHWRSGLNAYLQERRKRLAQRGREIEHVMGTNPATCGACRVASTRGDGGTWPLGVHLEDQTSEAFGDGALSGAGGEPGGIREAGKDERCLNRSRARRALNSGRTCLSRFSRRNRRRRRRQSANSR